MLPPHIDALLREQIETDLQTKGASQRDLAQRAAQMALKSGLRVQGIHTQELLKEIGVRAEVISEAISKVLRDVNVKPYSGLIEDLVQLFESYYDQMVVPLRATIIDEWHEIGGTGDGHISEQIGKWKAAERMEIKRLGAAIMEPAIGARSISISVENSQVGAIQTGEGSIVGTGISIRKEDSAKLSEAIRELADNLGKIPNLDETKRAELREVIKDVESELAKDKPNTAKVGGSLSILLATIKGVETLKAVYDMIAPFLPVLGIHLGG